MLSIGDQAPNFSVLDQDSSLKTLKDFQNQKIVMWFFPKASTPG